MGGVFGSSALLHGHFLVCTRSSYRPADYCLLPCVAAHHHSTRFEVAPNTLVLCLKRFGTGRFGKINKVLVYGEKLDLAPFMAQGAMDDGGTTYTLTGVVVHLDQVRRDKLVHCSGQWLQDLRLERRK